MSSKPNLLVVRAFPRPAEFDFYTHFNKFNVRLIGNFKSLHEHFKGRSDNIESALLLLKKVYPIDPFEIMKGKFEHRSFVYFENLEEHVKGCDVVNISDTYYFYCKQAAVLAKKYNKPLVTIVWENNPNHLARYIPPYSGNIKAVKKNTALYILRNKKALEFTDSLGVLRDRVKVIYKGVDLKKFFPRKSESNSKTRILFVGQLVETKGIKELIDTFTGLYKKIKDVELVLVGEGPMKKYVKKIYRNYPVKVLGKVDYSELPEIYRQADIFCSPSKAEKFFGLTLYEERFSYTLMEAQASGLPIVATRCGGIPEEVGGRNLLVNQGDVEGLFKALSKLILDKSLREEIGKANRKRAEKLFDLRKQTKKTENAILSLLT